MASSVTERADEAEALPQPEPQPEATPSDEPDGGSSDAPKAAEVAPVEAAPVEPAATGEAPPPAEQPSPAEAAPVEVEPPPAARVVEPPPAESVVEPPPSVSAREEASAAPGALASFWSARPSRAWLVAGAGGMLATLVVGIVIGRSLGGAPERVTVASVSPAKPAAPEVVARATPPPAEAVSAALPAPKTGGAPTKPVGAGFNAQAAKLAIDRVVPRLKGCKQPGEPPGSATVTVTFAATGRVSEANVSTTRYADTRTGRCIVARLREARIPEFTGKPVTVKRSVAVR